MLKIRIILSAILLSACTTLWSQSFQNMVTKGRSGEEMFFSDTSNAYFIYKPYPVVRPDQTPAPKGFKPVYVSSYSRHGSRKLHLAEYSRVPREILSKADSLGKLTALGKEVLHKVILIDDDSYLTSGELTAVGRSQHRMIADRLVHDCPEVFLHKGAHVSLYSTASQRTILSMVSCKDRLQELNPHLCVDFCSSEALTYLRGNYYDPYKDEPHALADQFISEHLEKAPVLDRLFEDGSPRISDTLLFLRCLYLTGTIVPDLDIDNVGFLRKVFTDKELYVFQQAMNYMMYSRTANSPLNGRNTLPAMVPLLKDIVDKADAALSSGRVGADLRYGHDIYLVPLVALMGVDGYDKMETDPMKVTDVFQDYAITPMAGNIRIVFYRDRKGEVLVRFLLNEVESTVPVPTDMFPFYHWNDVKTYYTKIIHGNS